MILLLARQPRGSVPALSFDLVHLYIRFKTCPRFSPLTVDDSSDSDPVLDIFDCPMECDGNVQNVAHLEILTSAISSIYFKYGHDGNYLPMCQSCLELGSPCPIHQAQCKHPFLNTGNPIRSTLCKNARATMHAKSKAAGYRPDHRSLLLPDDINCIYRALRESDYDMVQLVQYTMALSAIHVAAHVSARPVWNAWRLKKASVKKRRSLRPLNSSPDGGTRAKPQNTQISQNFCTLNFCIYRRY